MAAHAMFLVKGNRPKEMTTVSLGSIVHKVVVNAEADAAKVKNAILKAVQEVDGIVLPEAEKLQPTIDAVADAIVPGGAKIINIAYAGLEALAKLLDAGGAAAESNLSNAGLDVALIGDIKTLIPQLKAAAKS